MTDLKQPMTLEDFVLIMPLIINEVVSACTEGASPSEISEISNDRQIVIANRLFDLANDALLPKDKLIFGAMATALIQSEPDDY